MFLWVKSVAKIYKKMEKILAFREKRKNLTIFALFVTIHCVSAGKKWPIFSISIIIKIVVDCKEKAYF